MLRQKDVANNKTKILEHIQPRERDMKFSCQSASRLAAILLCTTSMSAFAQAAPGQRPAAEGDSSGFQEIVVTARRRSESAQNVPSAVLAVNAGALIQRGIKNESDLQTAVPGLVIKANNNQNQLNYVIRGQSVEPYSGSTPGVQPYFNDVALSGNAATAFYDVQSIQVLKGPQGTLFGRNSTGGAVLYQSAAPTSEVSGFVSGQYGNLDKLILEGALSLPIVTDKVLLRVAGTYQSGGAFVRNVYNNSKLGDTKVRSGRLTLKVMPTETITNSLMVQYSRYTGTNSGNRIFYTEPCGGANPSPASPVCWAVPGNAFYQKLLTMPTGTYSPGYPNGNVFPGGLAALPAYLDSLGKHYVSNDGSFDFGSKDTLVSNTTEFDLSDTMTIKNVIGYTRTKRGFEYDNDGSPYPFLYAGGNTPGGNNLETRNTKAFSEELQLQGKAMDNKLNYIVGVFYADSKTFNNSPIAGFGYIPAFDFPYTFALRYKSTSKDETKAVFGQVTYAVTDKLNLTGGLRGTWDKLSLEQAPDSSLFVAAIPKLQKKQNDISWTASADYHFTPALMAYLTTRGSWRVGGYNPFVAASLTGSNGQPIDPNTATADVGGTYFPPETVRDVEAGVKFSGRIGDVPVRINMDVYNSWIDNLQKTAYGIVAGNITSTTTIVPAGEVTGVEIDGEIKPASWLRLGASFAYADARYTKNIAIAFGTPNMFGPFADSPKYTGTAYADVIVPLSGNGGTLTFHLDGYGQSSYHVSSLGNTLNPGDKLDGYELLNGRIDWENPVGLEGWTASFFVKNITDKRYFIGGGGGIQLYSINSAIFGQPQTYGGVLRYSF
ncbi:MAG: TonB-dependent receptor [Alphaproteobacteria bacterium]|nr:MAG: TonB-dependent receptor [Alphaproteobacteria bacterium]